MRPRGRARLAVGVSLDDHNGIEACTATADCPHPDLPAPMTCWPYDPRDPISSFTPRCVMLWQASKQTTTINPEPDPEPYLDAGCGGGLFRMEHIGLGLGEALGLE